MQLFGLVFKALADTSRRRLLDRVCAKNGQTLTEPGAVLDMTRQSVTTHLRILEEAHLLVTERQGRSQDCDGKEGSTWKMMNFYWAFTLNPVKASRGRRRRLQLVHLRKRRWCGRILLVAIVLLRPPYS